MSSFSKLKKASGNKKSLGDLTAAVKALASGKSNFEDDRLWNITRDKQGNGEAIIRFLPPTDGDKNGAPYVRVFKHYFKQMKGIEGGTGWYIENSLTTLGDGVPDPVGEYNSAAWQKGRKDIARNSKRNLEYYSNIYVVKDPENPDNEGKVFLYKYGARIFNMLNDAMNPKFASDDPLNPFDLWEGANWHMKVFTEQVTFGENDTARPVPNYTRCEFMRPGPLASDDEMEKIWSEQYNLYDEFLDPKNFKTYDELKKKRDRVLGLDGHSSDMTDTVDALSEDTADYKPAREAAAPAEEESSVWDDDEATDDKIAKFFDDDDDDEKDEIPF